MAAKTGPKEATIVAAIVRELRRGGYWVTKLHGGPTQQAGLPDLLAVKLGRAFFIEVKRPGEAPTPLQWHTLRQLRAAGAVAIVATSAANVLDQLDPSRVF